MLKRRDGFTLTELLVVIAIIMLLSAAAVPALSAFRRGQRLDQSARLVQSALNDARRLSITKRARHVVVFYEYEDTAGQVDTVRHAIKIYQEPTGVKPGTGIPEEVSRGYWPGGYVGDTLVLPANIRFRQESMECTLSKTLPPEESEFFVRKLRGEQMDALAFRRDGTVEDRKDSNPSPQSEGRNIFLPDEGCYQVPVSQRADIVLMETNPNGDEVKSGGKSRRGMIDISPATGRALSRTFDVSTSYEYMPTAGQSGMGGS
jgi:prepilin-type N-terminal cleavage/methylation domain-containing protein